MAVKTISTTNVTATAGKQTNAGDQTVHADTGVLLAAAETKDKQFRVRSIVGGSVAAVWQIQRRDAANGSNVAPSPYTVYTAAGASLVVVLTTRIAPGERVRITNDGAITGTTAAAIDTEPLG